jgi:hypothetical protein
MFQDLVVVNTQACQANSTYEECAIPFAFDSDCQILHFTVDRGPHVWVKGVDHFKLPPFEVGSSRERAQMLPRPQSDKQCARQFSSKAVPPSANASAPRFADLFSSVGKARPG